MNLKKLALASVLILTGGCNERELDQDLVNKIWAKTIEVTEISDKGLIMPEMKLMSVDLYQKILKMDCESESGDSKTDCLAGRKELEDSVLQKTGKDYKARYSGYVRSERNVLAENCESYSDKEKKKQCESDKLSKKNLIKILGRAFLAHHYVEIYYENIRGYLDRREKYYAYYHIPFTYGERESFFYSVIAHEFLHVALYWKKNPDGSSIDIDDHHKLMKEKYMDPLLNFISDHQKTARKGLHREFAFGSLEVGIESDEASKRVRSRQEEETGESKSKDEILVLPCGLRLP